ncbi:MAG: EipA family protein [Pseudomonadota bacterium]
MMLRSLIIAALGLMVAACVSPNRAGTTPPPPPPNSDFSQSGTVDAVENWLGVSAETAGTLVERAFGDLGEPVGYIYGEEASGAIGAGLRYGAGTLVMEDGRQMAVYWQGPSIGWDLGANASKTFTLVYGLQNTDRLYQRFPGVEGTAYLVGGVGANYQRADEITLVPMRAGVGARLGANVGYLAYSREARVVPF